MKRKKQSESTSVNGSAQTWAQPYAQAGASDVQNVFNQNQPGLQATTDLLKNSILQPKINSYSSSLATAGLGRDFLGNMIGGDYGNSNPEFQNVINNSARDIRDNVNANYSSLGRYGSAYHDDAVANQVGQMSSNLRYQNYNDNLARMGTAAEAAGNMANQDYTGALTGAAGLAELPYTGSNSLANSLGALFNGGASKSVTYGPSLFDKLLSGAAAGASAAAAGCDVRLKENITVDHVEPDGLVFYRFNYKKGFGFPDGVHINPMAQDVERLRPWAMGPEIDGYKTIFPAKL